MTILMKRRTVIVSPLLGVLFLWALCALPAPAAGQKPPLKMNTEEISALKGVMKTRVNDLQVFMQRGVLGIGSDGLLVIRDPDAVILGKLGKKDRVELLVANENETREALIQAVADANGIGPDGVPEVRKRLAKGWQKKAKAGWWIQNQEGEWHQKKK